MDKDYEEFIQTLPKLDANWDKNARPQKPKVAQIPNPVKKVKKKNRPVPPKTKEPAFEDVVFVTPPMTPQPQPDTFVPHKSENRRDDEFWDFYDKGLPSV